MTDPNPSPAHRTGLRLAPVAGGVVAGVGVLALASSVLSLPPKHAAPLPAISVASQTPASAIAAAASGVPSTADATALPAAASPSALPAPVSASPAPTSASPSPSRSPRPTARDTEDETSPSPTRTRTATPTRSTTTRKPSPTPTRTTTTRKPSPTPTRTTTRPAPVYPVVDVYAECGRSGAGPFAAVGTGNATTSCAFARNVWTAYAEAGLNGRTGRVLAYSPATNLLYAMSCSGSQPAVCRGGKNGFVLIYGGRSV